MHVLLLEPAYYTRYSPLGLLKLAAWHRQHGDTVQLLRGLQGLSALEHEPQRVYITSLFTWAWRPVHDTVWLCRLFLPRAEIHLGGVYASLMPDHARTAGADVVQAGVIPELEDLLPPRRSCQPACDRNLRRRSPPSMKSIEPRRKSVCCFRPKPTSRPRSNGASPCSSISASGGAD